MAPAGANRRGLWRRRMPAPGPERPRAAFCPRQHPWRRSILDGITPFEASRIWLDGAPWPFFLEIGFRSLLAYFTCFLLIRLLNGRAVAQMSMTDLILVIALGSAVGDLTFYADVPILHALAAMTVIVVATKLVDRAIHNQDWLKVLLANAPVVLVRDGVIDMAGCSRRDLNTLEVMEMLRLTGIRNLGEVEWAFMEAGGQCSVFRHAHPRAGLRIVPPLDLLPAAPESPPPRAGEDACCRCCGLVRAKGAGPGAPCPNCASESWVTPCAANQEVAG